MTERAGGYSDEGDELFLDADDDTDIGCTACEPRCGCISSTPDAWNDCPCGVCDECDRCNCCCECEWRIDDDLIFDGPGD